MTLGEAKRVLGKEANDVSDEELEKEIEIANLLKDLFFDKIIKGNNASQ